MQLEPLTRESEPTVKLFGFKILLKKITEKKSL